MPAKKSFYKIGIYIEKALNEKNMSVLQLSKETGIRLSALRNYIINRTNPSIETIEKIAKALDKDVSYFTEQTLYKDGEMRAHALKYDLLIDFEKGNPKSINKCYKAIEKMTHQIFNGITQEGQEQLVEKFFMFLVNEVCPIAEKSKIEAKTYYGDLFTTDSYRTQSKNCDRKTLYFIINSLVKDKSSELNEEQDNPIFDENQVEEMTKEFLNKFDTLEEIQKSDNEIKDEENG